MRILRVFPRRTNATPATDLVRIGEPGLFDPPDCDEVHVSVTFTWDILAAKRIADAWDKLGLKVLIGGPAFDDPGGDFDPGVYLRLGHTITSRGCPNHCWFCSVPKREGDIRELPIMFGWKVHDSNLLACSRRHIENVFGMLARQPHRPEFLGGLEAARLEPWHVERLGRLRARAFFAYDTSSDLEPLQEAGQLFNGAGCVEQSCYVLIGYKSDTMAKAEQRCRQAWAAGFLPYAMLYRDKDGKYDRTWRRFQRSWCRPAAVRAQLKVSQRSLVYRTRRTNEHQRNSQTKQVRTT